MNPQVSDVRRRSGLNRGPSQVRATRTQAGTLVQATYALASPAALPAVTGQGVARDLLLIDALASRWGHSGDERARTLWAFCPRECDGRQSR